MGFFIKTDLKVVEIGALAMRLQCVVMPLQAINIIISMLFQSIGKPTQASLTALSRQGLFFIPVVLVMSQTLGVLGIQLSQPISDLGTFLLSIIMFFLFIRNNQTWGRDIS